MNVYLYPLKKKYQKISNVAVSFISWNMLAAEERLLIQYPFSGLKKPFSEYSRMLVDSLAGMTQIHTETQSNNAAQLCNSANFHTFDNQSLNLWWHDLQILLGTVVSFQDWFVKYIRIFTTKLTLFLWNHRIINFGDDP